ncbi:MAG: glycosyltransferase [Bacteroidetes bacterium]|nr:glycosyltransferase [Bacteroidota bacterium]
MDYTNQNILFISSWYPSRILPTDGNFNEKFAEASALFNNVSAIHVIGDSGITAPYEIDQFIKANVKTQIWYFRKKTGSSVYSKIINGYRYLKYYFKAFKRHKKISGKPDIIHLNVLFPAGLIVLLLKLFYNVKYVISEHWTGYLPSNEIKRSALVKWASKRIAKNASTIMPVTENLKEAMLCKGLKNKYIVVPNVVDIKYFFPIENRKKSEKKVILHVSSLKDDHKNVSGILRVINELKKIRNDFELKIVGDGDLEPHIKYAEKLSLDSETVKFYGTMTTQEIAEVMQLSDIFLLFSNYENLPCVIIEAFAAGIPVISTDVGGIREHLTIDKGILIEPKDEKTLIESLNKTLDNLDYYNKQELHRYAANNFSYEKIGKSFTEIYSSVIKNQRIV